MKKTYGTILCALVITFTLNGLLSISNVFAQELKREECLIYTEEEGITVLPGKFFNPLSPDVQSVWYNGIFETLYIFDPVNFALIPWLADGKPVWVDPYTLEVKLKDAYWQDYTPLTAEDVVYTYSLAKKYPELGGDLLAMWSALTDIKAVDEHTIRFYVNESRPFKVSIYQVLCTTWIVPKHIFEEAEKKYESIVEFPYEEPIGSGVYKLLRWESTRIIKERWDDWWGRKYFGLPEPKYLIYTPSPGNEETNRMMITAEVDGLSAIAPGWKDMQKYGVYSWFKEPPFVSPFPVRVNFYAINNERFEERFGEYAINIKYALAYAIDREVISERGFFQLAVPLSDPTFILPDSPLAFLRNEEVVEKYTFTYDPEKAMKILDDAGIKDVDGDGIRETPEGAEVTLVTIDVEGWTDWMAANELLKAYADAIGLSVEVQHLDYSVWLSRVRAGDYDMMTYGASAWAPAGLWSFLGIFDYRYPSWPNLEGSPLRYVNDEICRLRDEVAKYPDPFDPKAKPVLKDIFARIQEIIARDMPVIPSCVWGYEFGFQTKYWTGWPTEDDPYPFEEQGSPGFIYVIFHLRSTAAPITPEQPVISPELNETIVSIYEAVSRIESSLSELGDTIRGLSSTIGGLTSWLTGLLMLNVVILIVAIAAVVVVVKRTAKQ